MIDSTYTFTRMSHPYAYATLERAWADAEWLFDLVMNYNDTYVPGDVMISW